MARVTRAPRSARLAAPCPTHVRHAPRPATRPARRRHRPPDHAVGRAGDAPHAGADHRLRRRAARAGRRHGRHHVRRRRRRPRRLPDRRATGRCSSSTAPTTRACATGRGLQPRLFLPEGKDRKLDDDDEGCLSLPGAFVPCARPSYARVEGQGLDGSPVSFAGDGLLARCLQHETDHCHGTVFGDRLNKRSRKKLFKQADGGAEDFPAGWPAERRLMRKTPPSRDPRPRAAAHPARHPSRRPARRRRTAGGLGRRGLHQAQRGHGDGRRHAHRRPALDAARPAAGRDQGLTSATRSAPTRCAAPARARC